MQKNIILIFIIISMMVSSCDFKKPEPKRPETESNVKINLPEFNSDSAYNFVEKQVLFGPRVPNTTAHEKCAEYLAKKLGQFSDTVIVQNAKLKAWNGTLLNSFNIIGSFNVNQKNRVLLFAHWDSRPYADQEEDAELMKKPIDGASDGASGVGVLLEIARVLSENNPNIGVDIIFFDAEDYGKPSYIEDESIQNDWCLGTQYWCKNPHVKNYTAKYGILLDMVGAKNAIFALEGTSMYFASDVMIKTWDIANDLGYSDYFKYIETGNLTDDHLYVNQMANIPSIDIIQYDPNSNRYFAAYWHTHNDKMDIIDKNTLKAVGQTVIGVLFSEK